MRPSFATFTSTGPAKLFSLILTGWLIFQAAAPVAGQTIKRRLPKAGFVNTLQPSIMNNTQGGQLPTSYGVHLAPGMDRPRNASHSTPYDPGEPSVRGERVRWEPRKMPLRVFISYGIQLPECPFEQLQATRVDQVLAMLRNPIENPFMGLPQAPGWKEEINMQVAEGIEMWRPFESEGLFSFEFTNNPRDAHVLVFFVNNFVGADQPGGISVGGNTCAKIYQLSQVQQHLAQGRTIGQTPVIIEMSIGVNHEPEKMRAASAHEFGHALGIKAHSPYREDIMHENRVVEQLSPADKATIRSLYKNPAPWVM